MASPLRSSSASGHESIFSSGGTGNYRQSLDDGSIQLIIGPMFAGKTSELMRRVKRWQVVKPATVVVLKHEWDNRYDAAKVVNHNGVKSDAHAVATLESAIPLVENASVIAIDEAQFFSDLVEMVDRWAEEGKVVIVAGLDADCRRNPFANVVGLVHTAESVCKLTAICNMCFQDASFTSRVVYEDKLVLVGAKDAYAPRCRACFTFPPSAKEEVPTAAK